MKSRLAALLAIGLFALAATFARPVAADDEAQRFIASIYAQYGAPDTQGVVLDSKEALEKYFVPELAATIDADAGMPVDLGDHELGGRLGVGVEVLDDDAVAPRRQV